MNRLVVFIVSVTVVSVIDVYARTDGYTVRGKVIDRSTREGIPYAAVVIVGVDGYGVSSDSTGVFVLENVRPGINSFSAIQLGYRIAVTPEYKITPYTPFIEIEMEEDVSELTASSVKPSPFLKSVESPLSVRIISVGGY